MPLGTQYCAPSDLLLTGINPFALQDVAPANLPVLAYPPSVTYHAAQIAVFYCLKTRGYNPESGADSLIKQDAEAAEKWFEKIARQTITVAGLVWAVNQPGDPVHDLPQVISQPQRGWSTFSASGRPSIW
jgi:hypothetical protein